MNSESFEVTAHAKWILAGEHAVIRGHPALVFPVPDKFVKLTFYPTQKSLNADFLGPYGDTLLLIFWGLIEESLKLVSQNHKNISGKFTVLNNIPMGTGLGFSAALCVAVSHWILWKGWIKNSELFEFATKLEDFFHGKSSGVDIAGALSKQCSYFTQADGVKSITLSWKPLLYLSYSGKISVTAQSIEIVNTLWETDKLLASKIDNLMKESVELAKTALTETSTALQDRENSLVDAIRKANNCFEQWGLNRGEVKDHLHQLMQNGALATKSTGAGNGGYVISLWKEPPASQLPFEMMPII